MAPDHSWGKRTTLRPEVEINDDEPVLDEATWLRGYTEQSEYSRFSLGEWVRDERQPRGHHHTFVPRVDLDAETFERYYESTVPYRRMTERRTYQLLRQATRRLHATVQLHTNLHKYGVRLHENLDGHRSALVITGSVSDWLSASFVYLQTEETFWKHCGEEESVRFKQATNDAYDTYPAYRFLYQLRNYAHHYGPPLAALDYSTDVEDGWNVDIMVDKRTLLGGSFDWNDNSKAVMAGLPERFAIMPLITEAMKGYRLIERRTLRMYLDYFESWLDEHEMLEALGEVEGMPCLLAIPPDRSKAMQVAGAIGIRPIPIRERLDKVEWSLRQPDTIDCIWVDQPPSPGFSPDDEGALRATAVLAAYFAGDRDAAVEQANQIVFELDEGDPSPLFGGLINRSATTMYMLASLLGSSPEELLNTNWTEDVEDE